MIRTPWRLTLVTFVLALACISPAISQAFPEPAVVTQSWELAITYKAPKPIAVRDASGDTHWYWYMTYKVVNRTGEDRLFVPEVEIATDAGDLVRSGQDVPSAVFFAISDNERNKFLESPNLIVGKLLQGEDFARESVIVWPAFDHDVDQISLFIAGLSGESQVIKQPLTGQPVTVRKTLMLTYNTPGDSMTTPAEQQTITSAGREWIMR